MGLFDLPAPLFELLDRYLGLALPDTLRLALWGILAGWMTMILYRKLSRQDRIQQLKAEQKAQQKIIAAFDGELQELFPLIRHALSLGVRQLGLSLGPALLATIPVLFIVVWVSGAFGYQPPLAGASVTVRVEPDTAANGQLAWSSSRSAQPTAEGWVLNWPGPGQKLSLMQDGKPLFALPLQDSIPVLHKRRWWNWLMANPAGYLPDEAVFDAVHLALPEQQFVKLGPGWLRGWMFTFFGSFLLSSIAFKLALKID
jgi:hypothetical protein